MTDAASNEVPCVVRQTATWEQQDGDARWVLIDASIDSNETYYLEFGTNVQRSSVADGLSVSNGDQEITIDTGPLELVFSRTNSTLIAGAAVEGTTFLSASGQKRMYMEDDTGVVARTSNDSEDYLLEVEQSGPLHAIIKATGWYRADSGTGLCEYVTRVHAYAGESFVRIVHTFIVAYDTDQVRLKDICVPFVPETGHWAQASFGISTNDITEQHPMQSGYLLQDHHTNFVVNSTNGVTVAQGARASGWFDVSTTNAGLCVGLRHIWQEFPKELEAAEGEMRVHLWPPHQDAPLDWGARATLGPERYAEWDQVYHGTLYEGGLDQYDQAMGVAKTSEMILSFHNGNRTNAISQSMTLEHPIVVSAEPEWMCNSDVFGRLGHKGSGPYPEVERKIDLAWESFEERRTDREDYGMIHYGDVQGKGPDRGWRHWASRFYGFPVLPWVMLARTGEPRFLVFALDNAKHVMDIDMCHVDNSAYGDYGYYQSHKYAGKRRGARYGGDGGIIHYAAHMYDIGCDSHVDQWTYAYYLTGYRRAWDILTEEGEYYLELDTTEPSTYLHAYAHRMTGGAIRTMIALYRATWDERYLTLAESMAQQCYDAQDHDGTVRYDDVYMNPGFFTYYQATSDERMLDLFLRSSQKAAEGTEPLTDTRFYLFYGPAMAYFVTTDTTYLTRSMEWLTDFLSSEDGSGGYLPLTVQRNYIPYLIEALTTYTVEPGASWYDERWLYRQKITIESNRVTGVHTNFPLLVAITRDSPVFYRAKPDGSDILFTESNGVTRLFYEKEGYDAAVTTLTYWVKCPVLSSARDTVLYMYYGSEYTDPLNLPIHAWDDDHRMVLHLEETAQTPASSVAFDNDMLTYGAPDQDVEGQIDGADGFDGTNAYFRDSGLLDPSNGVTEVMWVYPTNTPAPGTHSVVGYKHGSGWGTFGIHMTDTSWRFFLRRGEGDALTYFTAGTHGALHQWYHVALTYDGVDLKGYVNGVEVDSENIPGHIDQLPSNDHIYIGAFPNFVSSFYGLIDEFRVSVVARSGDWIKTCYDNQGSPATFLSFSEEESAPGMAASPAGWPPYSSNRRYRQRLLIRKSQVAGVLTNFPVLVTEASIRSALWAHAQPDGDDIFFTDDDGVTRLSHETEKYDNTAQQLAVWVKIPLLDPATNNAIYMYYGNDDAPNGEDRANAWNESYVSVWHMRESPTDNAPQVKDSTSHGYHGTCGGNMLNEQQVAGQVNGSLQFDGSDDGIDTTLTAYAFTNSTLSAWVQSRETGDGNVIGNPWDGGSNDYKGWELRALAASMEFRIAEADSNRLEVTIGTITTGEWHHVAVANDNGTIRPYLNGVARTTTACGGHRPNSGSVVMATYPTGTYRFRGVVDEIRISDTVRSEEWIETSYNNQSDPGVFLMADEEEKLQLPAGTFVHFY